MNWVQTVAKLRNTARDLVEMNHLEPTIPLYHVHSLYNS